MQSTMTAGRMRLLQSLGVYHSSSKIAAGNVKNLPGLQVAPVLLDCPVGGGAHVLAELQWPIKSAQKKSCPQERGQVLC